MRGAKNLVDLLPTAAPQLTVATAARRDANGPRGSDSLPSTLQDASGAGSPRRCGARHRHRHSTPDSLAADPE